MADAPYRKAVILGAAGFIGTTLARTLAAQTFDLICFDRVISPQWPKASKVIIGDFAAMPAELLSELNGAVVFHLIGTTSPSPNTAQTIGEINHDLSASVRYLEATKNRQLRWVFLSSGGTVYGPTDDRTISEISQTNPICSYGLVKLTIERYFSLYRKLYDTDYVVVRLSNPYGPGQSPLKGQGLVAALVHKALHGQTAEIWGDGENVRDYIYIADASEGIVAAARAGESGETYNIGTARGLSINQLVEIIGDTLNMPIPVKYSAARAIDVRRNVLDFSKLSSRAGWAPATALPDGIKLTAAWQKETVGAK